MAAVPLQVGGQAAGAPPDVPMSLEDQLMTILQTRQGGPQLEAMKAALRAQIMAKQTAQYSSELDWQNKLRENTQLGLGKADRERIDAELKAKEDAALFANQLPQTADEIAKDKLKRDELAEQRTYHQALTGAGLGENGLVDPQTIAYRDQILAGNMTMGQVPQGRRGAVARSLSSVPTGAFSPLAGQRFSTEATKIATNYIKLPGYTLTAQGLPYLERIDAALKTPGSVADQELLDSFTKLSTAGNAVTEAQVHLVTEGKSLGDWFAIQKQKLQNGGSLSPKQRADIKRIANETYAEYKKGYQPIYDEVASKMTAAGIPKQFWTIPDLNKLNAGHGVTGGTGTSGGGGKVKVDINGNPI
jgi:hypothetical protein